MAKKVTSKAVMDIMIEGAKEVKKEVIPEKKKELAIKTMKKVEKQIKNEEVEAPPKKEKVKVEVINSPVKPKTKTPKELKKLSEKVKSELPKPETPEDKEDRFKNETIDYTIEETTMYAVNWFYLRTKFIAFCNILIYPYVYYAAWFNRTFNRPRILRELQNPDNQNNTLQSKIFRKGIEKDWKMFKPEAKTDKPPVCVPITPEFFESDK
jgi:hypothetical protein